ncbi:LANO_0H24146g1_1 [Lachancea nothofagi CBS 11611]|uniref:LANO_0H24146g1_1 n=1 Tax=Lachancea nothofagi CBS 11611 TaxID=1266666 RepID=A0A1G4KNT0_9SACH|nr:LANO_0H24146g1_1 [Lachancea nothofagi CBS 11611]
MSFIRHFHAPARLESEISKVVKNGKKMQQMKATANLYNPKSSASSYKGVLRAKIEPGLYHHPAHSSDTGSINSETFPRAFLPNDDPRRKFVQTLRPREHQQSSWAPPLHQKKDKTYHLSPEQVAEIQKLRLENPEKYTRKALAQRFNVSPLFISLISSVSETRSFEMAQRLDAIKQNWHPRRAIARDDRKKRKELWYRP